MEVPCEERQGRELRPERDGKAQHDEARQKAQGRKALGKRRREVKKSRRRRERQLETDIERQKRLEEEQRHANESKKASRVVLALQSESKKREQSHCARTNGRRHAAREHAVQHDDDSDENSRHDGTQAKKPTEPSHDRRQQRDM